MTTTVRVQARAWGALVVMAKITEGVEGHVTEDHQETLMGANEDRTFHLGEGYLLTVSNGKEPSTDQAEDTQEELNEDTSRVVNKRRREPSSESANTDLDPPSTI